MKNFHFDSSIIIARTNNTATVKKTYIFYILGPFETLGTIFLQANDIRNTHCYICLGSQKTQEAVGMLTFGVFIVVST